MPRKTRWTSTPASTSSAARRSAFGVVLVYWKRPVSVTRATYSASAISASSGTSSSRKRSRTISPVEDASATTWLSVAKRVLSWWWPTSIDSGTLSSNPAAAPIRCAFAQSSASSTRSPASAGSSRCSSSSGRKAYSAGGSVSPPRYMTLSLPRRSSPSLAPRIDPSASPSGFSCVTSRKRSWLRIASATAARSAVGGVLIVVGVVGPGSEVVDQLRHPHPLLDGRIVFEGELRSPLELELVRDLGLEDAARRRQAAERRVALPRAPAHADVDRGVLEVSRRGHAGHGHEADPRVLEIRQRLGQHLPDRLVDAAHPLSHRDRRSPSPRARAPTPARRDSARRRRAAAAARCGRARRTPP